MRIELVRWSALAFVAAVLQVLLACDESPTTNAAPLGEPAPVCGAHSGHFAALAETRIDIVMMGDSNQFQQSTGWDHGIQYALAQRAPMWATSLLAYRENAGNGIGAGYGFAMFAQTAGDSANAPAELHDVHGPHASHDYCYVDDAGSIARGTARGLILQLGGPLDVDRDLRFEFHYGVFPAGAGAGQFQPGVRNNGPAPPDQYTALATGPATSTIAADYGMGRLDLDLPAPASPRRHHLIGGFTMPFTSDIEGPFFGSYIRAINPDRASGWSFHSVLGVGGDSTADLCDRWDSAGPGWGTYYFGEIRRAQTAQGQDDVRVVIMINTGLNDRNETASSRGRCVVTDGNSGRAYFDNIAGLVSRVTQVWINNGWDRNELEFVIIPSHPVSDPDDAALTSYRLEARALATLCPNVTVVDLSVLTNEAEMLAQGWYRSGGADRAHLEQPAYEVLGGRIVDVLIP